LVIDTIGQKVGPLSMVDRFGTPFRRPRRGPDRYPRSMKQTKKQRQAAIGLAIRENARGGCAFAFPS
jgi:hypothetical protein